MNQLHTDPEAFVGTAVFTAHQLQACLQTWPEHYFQRWRHRVSWEAPNFEAALSPEGQAFNHDCELRWKQQGERYKALLLSTIALSTKFEAIGQGWRYRDRPAHFYSPTETRFPQSFSYPDINIAQRYFIDARTATVQFVAFTVKP
jgi:hypothetical protein